MTEPTSWPNREFEWMVQSHTAYASFPGEENLESAHHYLAGTAGRLAQIFAPLASQGVDLSAVTILAPQLTEVPTIDPERQMLRLKGFFPGQPLQINFELLYEPVGGRWRLFGLSVNAVSPSPAAAAPEKKKATPAPTGKAK